MKPSAPSKTRNAKKARRGAPAARRVRGGENLVAEIVDQITEKQARESVGTMKRRSTAGTCSFCLDESVASSPYRVILKCDTGEGPRSGH